MLKDQLDLFVDRQEALLLFEKLSQRSPNQPWPFFPILSLVGPSGYGKSRFIQHLDFHYGTALALPHVTLDVGKPEASRDLLNILGTLRNNLYKQRDNKGKNALSFPRFDILYSRLERAQERQAEGQADNEIEAVFSDLIGLFGNINSLVTVVLMILKWIIRVPPLQALIRWCIDIGCERIPNRPQWRWYQDQVLKFKEINLPPDATIGSILRRLNEMCTTGDPERDFLIEEILPKALLADLRYGAFDTENQMLATGPHCVVIFLDNFEVLLRSAEPTSRQLLTTLALNDYRRK